MSAKVKICGITSAEDAELAVRCGADMIGLNFYPRSSRYVALEVAREIRSVVPESVWCVGVFVNAERAAIEMFVEAVSLDMIQFHGDETSEQLDGWNIPTIKAIRVGASRTVAAQIAEVESNFLLFDTFSARSYGGMGVPFEWREVAGLSERVRARTILAGGLDPANVRQAVRAVGPWAVDVASGTEMLPGKKDFRKIKAFITNAKSTR